MLPHRGLESDLEEMHHCKQLGLKTVVVGRYQAGKSYPTESDDRFWAELQMPITIHTMMGGVRSGAFLPYPKQPEGEIPDDDYYLGLYRHAKPQAGGVEDLQMVMACSSGFPASTSTGLRTT